MDDELNGCSRDHLQHYSAAESEVLGQPPPCRGMPRGFGALGSAILLCQSSQVVRLRPYLSARSSTIIGRLEKLKK